MRSRLVLAASLALLQPCPARCEEGPLLSVEEIARTRRDSVVVISISDRQGGGKGTGSGFIVRTDGVVATNFHVIGQGRPFTVQLSSGATARPTAVLGVDRARDLALFQIEGKDLPALELGDSDGLRPGQPVLAVGHPLGLERSVAQGVVSELREMEGRKLIQVAMPIEPGSSGSPLLDMKGKVVGVIAIKSAGSVGFAVPVNDLRSLMERARPVPMARWLTIGALDQREWRTALGGEWRQRAGRIIASGPGDGFGGRTLCLSSKPPPAGPFEVSVEVKLLEESGAAGLVFHSDGGEKHYGFYPTAGSLRLTRFEGPDVFRWTILKTVSSDGYRPGEWNTIKVRVDGARITCWVNDRVAIEAEDGGLPPGLLGLVKFREPGAEFRRFRAGDRIPPGPPVDEEGPRALRDRARKLEGEARKLRSLAEEAHCRQVEKRLVSVLEGKEEAIDLLQAALLLALLDNPDLETEPYVEMVDRLAALLREKLPPGAGEEERLRSLLEAMFGEWGFHGSDLEYYHRSNSYLNEVLDDREGIPITLSIVFMELGRRLGLHLAGLGLPGHFMVEWRPAGGERRVIDVFNAGKVLTRPEAEAFLGRPLGEEDFAPATKREILLRMLRNLLGVAGREKDREGMLRYLDLALALDPRSGPDRWMRAVLRFQSSRLDGAAEDLDWLLEHRPPEVNESEVKELREALRERREG